MSGQSLFNELMDEQDKARVALKKLAERGKALAEAERDYKIALRFEILKLRDDGQPATLVLNLAYGTREIAKLRMERDIADAMYRSAMEALNLYKLNIRILHGQLEKEFGSGE